MEKDIKFSKEHACFDIDNNIAALGITEYALSLLGHVIFLNLNSVGTVLNIGEKFGDIEGVKTVLDLISPIAGEILEVNEDLINTPDKISDDLFKSWLVKIKVSSVSNELLSQDEYLNYVRENS